METSDIEDLLDDESTASVGFDFDDEPQFKDHLIPVYVLAIYFSAYIVLAITISFYSEYRFQQIKNPSQQVRGTRWLSFWCEHIFDRGTYYFSFTLHVMDEATSIAWLLCMYYICCDRNGSDISQWPLLSRQPTPEMLFLVSFISWSLYKVGSLLYMIFIDIFQWFQILFHLLDINYIYEMHIAHSGDNKNPVEFTFSFIAFHLH